MGSGYSRTTTGVFRLAPIVLLATTVLAAALLPLDGKAALLSFPGDLVAFAGLLALGLMAKPMLVTLPFVLILLDVWPLRRVAYPADPPRAWLRLAYEKLPLFALSVASSVVTFLVQRNSGAVESLEN